MMSNFTGGRIGEGTLGSLLMLLMGNRMWPLAGQQQSQMDALWQRQHTLQMMEVGRNAVANSFPLQNLGFNGSSMPGSILTSILSSPAGGPMMNMFAPILGGNPVLAQQSTFANMQGMNMAGLGSIKGLSMAELSRATSDRFNPAFFNQTLQTQNERQELMRGRKGFQDIMSGVGYSVSSPLSSSDLAADTGFQNIAGRGSKLDNFLSKLSTAGRIGDPANIVNSLQSVTGVKDNNNELLNKIKKAVEDGTKAGSKDNGKLVADAIKDYSGTKAVYTASEQAQNYINLSDRQVSHGVNLRRSMGFAQEDIYGFLSESIRNRSMSSQNFGTAMTSLMGVPTNEGPTAMMRTMDAARGFFGRDLSGKQLAQATSDFIGFSNIDLSKDGDANRVTNAFAGLKGLSRSSNIDIDQLKLLVTQTQQLAGQYGQTGKFGGIEASDIVQKAVIDTQALAAVPGTSQYVRWQGGTNGMIGNNIAGQLESARQPIAYQLAAMYHSYAGNAAAQQSIANYAQNASGMQLTDMGFQRFIRTLPGNPIGNLQYAEFNTAAQNMGFDEANKAGIDLRGLGGKSATAAAIGRLQYHLGNTPAAAKAVKEGLAMVAAGNMQGFLTSRNLMQFSDSYATFNKLASSGYLEDYVANMPQYQNTDFSKNRRGLKEVQAQEVAYEKTVSGLMAPMNSDTATRMIQAVLNGEVTKEGVGAFGKALGIDANSGYVQEIYNAQSQIRNIKGDKTLEDALGKSGAGYTGAMLKQIRAGLAVRGLTGAQLKQIKDGGDIKQILNKDQLAKADGLLGDIKDLANNSALYSESGNFDEEGVRQNAIGNIADKLAADSPQAIAAQKAIDEQLSGAKGILKDYGDDPLLKSLSEGGSADSATFNKNYEAFIAEKDAATTYDKQGIPILGKEHQKLFDQQFKGQKFTGTDEQQKWLTSMDAETDATAGNKEGTRLKAWSNVEDNFHKEVKNIGKGAAGGGDGLPKMVSDLIGALNNIAKSING